MTFLFKKKTTTTASANVTDDHLILSLPTAQEPIVWRMALDKIGTAVFEVKQDKENPSAKLILKPKKGTAEIIATFKQKEDAVNALMAASNALQTAQAPSSKNTVKTVKTKTPLPETATQHSKNEGQKWIIALLGAIIVIGLYYYLTTLIPETNTEFFNQGASNNAVSTPQQTTGTPVSADDFLKGL